MTPEERLRHYLEQRRELGESEMVLDAMSVEEVMRILGARPSGAPRASSSPARAAAASPDAPPALAAPRSAGGAPADWRAALREAGGEPPPGDAPKARAQAPRELPPREAPPREAPPREAPPREAPPREASPGDAAETIERVPTPKPKAASSATHASRATTGADIGAPDGIVVGAGGTGLFAGPLSHVEKLEELAELVARCTRCPLYATAINPVPGEGSPAAELVCVGEAPGANEDETGRPFVGQAGQLLTKILAAIDLGREDVFICNVLKHRPPGNRNPRPEEVDACRPYLGRQLEIIRPKVILALGTFAAQTLLETKLSIGKLRGQVHRYHGIPLVVTYHPAALLRNPAWKRPTWEDVQLARRILDSVHRA